MPPVLEGAQFHDPSLTGPRASTEIPSGGLFSAYASCKINAPPEEVYNAILNVGDWRLWNRFVHDVTLTKTLDPHNASKRLQGGTCMIFQVELAPGDRIKVREVVTLVEKLKVSAHGHSRPCITRIRWRLDNAAITTPGFLLRTERVNEIEELEDGQTAYRTWQVFAGPIARFFLRKRVEIPTRDNLQTWCVDFKNWVEKKHKEAQVAGQPDLAGAQR